MMKAKFTKGEWSVDTSGYFTKVMYGGTIICNETHTFADAHLIAAAPDMYAALNKIINSYNDYSSNSISIDAEEVIAALKKARGEHETNT